MAKIFGMGSLNTRGGTNVSVAIYGNDLVNVLTGTGYGQNLTVNTKGEFEAFIDRLFFCNGTNANRSFNGTTWSTSISVPKGLRSEFQKSFKTRLYLGNCTLTPGDGSAISYPSRVFYSDLPTLIPSGSTYLAYALKWGLEHGDCSIRAGSTLVEAQFNPTTGLPYFRNSNIKVGDPFYILEGGAIGEYTIASIRDEYALTLTSSPSTSAISNVLFWTGGNWFDVGTDDNDEITGFAKLAGLLLIFKNLSLWYYTGSRLEQIEGALGTSSQQSVLSYKGYVYYFHGSTPAISGIYRTDGINTIRISRAIDPFIRGMTTSDYANVIGWREGEELRWFVSNITNSNYNIALSKAVATYNTITDGWDVGPIADTITAKTTYKPGFEEFIYTGTTDDQVLQMNDGNDFNGSAITAILETKPYYPLGSEFINEFTHMQVIGRAAKGTKVKYKLWDQPKEVDDEWTAIGELDSDKTELVIPMWHKHGSGIQLRFDDIGTLENDTYIEKVSIFYKPDRSRLLKV